MNHEIYESSDWVLEVEDFPVVVTMDSHNNSLHVEVEERSAEALERLLG